MGMETAEEEGEHEEGQRAVGGEESGDSTVTSAQLLPLTRRGRRLRDTQNLLLLLRRATYTNVSLFFKPGSKGERANMWKPWCHYSNV
jgi:hypothetical protein